MHVLVDFDNIDRQIRRNGARYVVESILDSFAQNELAPQDRIMFRLYGGWYDSKTPTRTAQDLVSEIDREFPFVYGIKIYGQQKKIRISAELAYSLAAAPQKHLFATFRSRPGVNNLQCKPLSSLNCKEEYCAMSLVHKFVTTGRCPNPDCSKTVDHFVFRDEQKLVDTMLCVDLLYYSEEPYLAIVTSDDDIWPGIIYALARGTRLTHIKTQSDGAYAAGYLQGLDNKYTDHLLGEKR